MGSAPAAPAQTWTTQTVQMDPRLYAMLFGATGSPGSQVMQASGRNAGIMNKVQQGDPTALAQFYGVSPGTDTKPFQEALNTANPGHPAPVRRAEGGEVPGYASGGMPTELTADQYNFLVGQQGKRNISPQWQALMDKYAQANPQGSPQPNVPYSMSDQYNTVPFFDPNTMNTTNPYYQQAIGQLTQMQQNMPGQYNQAGGMYGDIGKGLLGQTNFQAQQLGQQGKWTDSGNAKSYMNPYIETALKSQEDLSNRSFQQQLNQLRSQAAGAGAYGGSGSALAQQAAQQNQNLNMQNLVAQGMNTAYQQAEQQYTADRGRQLQADLANQQAGIQAQGLNLQAYNEALGAAGGLLNTGNSVAGYNQNLFSDWGQSGNTLQNLGQNWYQNRAQNASNFWNGVGTAAAPGTNLALQAPWGQSGMSNQNYYGRR